MTLFPAKRFRFVLPFFIFCISMPAFAAPADNSVTTYEGLLKAIRKTHHASQARIERAVRQEKVREAWETGKLIDEHILQHKERAEYGGQVIVKLARDLETSETELKYSLQFARTYPIRPPADELSWAHYRELLSINDSEEREEVTQQAVKEHWTRNQVRAEIRKRKPSLSSSGDLKLPEVKPGKIGVYRIVERNGQKYYDFGLSNYFALSGKDADSFREGDAAECRILEAESGKKQKKNSAVCVLSPESALSDFYTYEALVTRVVDGDSFHARIDLGFGFMTEQRVRLLRVDAAEIETGEGKEAKAYLEKLFSRNKNKILVKIFGEDQHGRPLAIVWTAGKSVEQELLDEGLAVAMQG